MKPAKKRDILTEMRENMMALGKLDFPSESGNVDTYDCRKTQLSNHSAPADTDGIALQSTNYSLSHVFLLYFRVIIINMIYQMIATTFCIALALKCARVNIGIRAKIHGGGEPRFPRMANSSCLSRSPAWENKTNNELLQTCRVFR